MSDVLITAILVTIPPTITAVAAIITSLRHNRKMTRDIDSLRLDVNGRVDELIAAARVIAWNAGVEDYRSKEKNK